MKTGTNDSSKIGRPVRAVSIGFSNQTLEAVTKVVDRAGAEGADLIILPELWPGLALESLTGPAVRAMREIAGKYSTYIICPIYRCEKEQRINSAILIGRQGEVAGIYDKAYPFWNEFKHKPPAVPGANVPVFQTDFGRVGIAICFDVNFPEVWKRFADQEAELVVFPSHYSAGSALKAHALNHHYYIISSTTEPDCAVIDITGEEIIYKKGEGISITRAILDLDRGIYHDNFNLPQRDRLLQERGADVCMEKRMARELWFVLKAKRPGISARDLARQYGMEELRDYINRSRREIDQRRGRPVPQEGCKQN